MPMNPNFLCCIGAELKNSTQQTTRMSQVYFYRAFENQTLNDMLQPGFFDAAMGIIRKDDLLLLYSPNETSAKYTYVRVSNVDRDGVEIESINIDAKDIIVDTDGFSVLDGDNLQEIIAQIDSLLPSDVSSLNKLIAESRLQSEITRRAVIKDSNVVQEMQSGLKAPSAEFDNAPTTNDTTTYQNATSDSLVRKEQVDEVIQDIKTSSLTFIGYVSTTAPSSATYALNKHDLWLNSATMPTSFPFPQANIKEWDGTAWVTYNHDYTPANFDFFRNVNNNEGYYWFGGEWVVMSTDMSTTYFQLNAISGKWEIKSNVNLPGAPTTTTPSTNDNSTKIATTAFVKNALDEKGGSGLNVGDIFSTMRNDNELNGAVECDGATYNTTDFTGAQSIGGLLEANKVPFVSLSVYATTIANQGWCDKFGWDGTGTTTFRVPTLNAYIWQKLQTGVVGTGILGFQNGSYLDSHDESLGSTAGWVRTHNSGGTWASVGALSVSSDPSASNLVAGAPTDISQQRVMIQLAVAASDEALETCTSVLADVATLKSNGLALPNYSAGVSVANITPSTPYTAPENGFLYGSVFNGTVYVNGSQVAYSDNTSYSVPVMIVLSRGDAVTVNQGEFNRLHFYPVIQ